MPRGTGEDAEGLNMGAIELLDLCETVAFVTTAYFAVRECFQQVKIFQQAVFACPKCQGAGRVVCPMCRGTATARRRPAVFLPPLRAFETRRADLYKCAYCGPRGTGDVPVKEAELDSEEGPIFRAALSDSILNALKEAAMGRQPRWPALAGTTSCDACFGTGTCNPGIPRLRSLFAFWRQSPTLEARAPSARYLDQLPAAAQLRPFREGGAPRLFEYGAPIANTREVYAARTKRLQHLEAKRVKLLATLVMGADEAGLAQEDWLALRRMVAALEMELAAVRGATEVFEDPNTSWALDSDGEGHVVAQSLGNIRVPYSKKRFSLGPPAVEQSALYVGMKELLGRGAPGQKRRSLAAALDAEAKRYAYLDEEWGSWVARYE